MTMLTSLKHRGHLGLAVLMSGFLFLSGCSTPDPYAVVPCPYIGVLADAKEITRFKTGGSRDVSDLEVHGEITRVDFSCVKPDNKNFVQVRTTVHTRFEQGMAAVGDQYGFNIFMVLSEREDRILKKQDVGLRVEFKGDRKVVTRETTIKNLRLPVEGALSPELHNIYLGFQLTPAEVAYNRTKEKS